MKPVTLTFCGKSYRVSIETIDSKLAQEYLAHNTNNRRMKTTNLRKLKGAIARGEWTLNGETIIFGTSGRLLQGQHRLQAVIDLETQPIVSFVVRDIPDRAFDTIDQGSSRSAPDVLGMRGEVNAIQLAAAARAIIHITEGAYAVNIASAREIEKIVDAHQNLKFWVAQLQACKARKFLSSSFAGVMSLVAERHGHDVALKFMTQVSEGENLTKGDPAKALRDRFMLRSRSEVIQQTVALAFYIKAINAYINGKQVLTLRWSTDEDFPQLA